MHAQPQIRLPEETCTMVLHTIQTARTRIPGHDEDAVLALIQEGLILHAWNIGLGVAQDIRILPASLDHYERTRGSSPDPLTADQALLSIHTALGGKPFTTGRKLKLLFNCSSSHITNLINAGRIDLLPDTQWGKGPHGSPTITWLSIAKFISTSQIA